MAFTELRTDYKDDELNESVNTNVVFIETDLDSGDTRNISLQDATSYTQMGDQLSASVLNTIGTVVNDIGSHVTAAENTLSNILNVFYPVGSYYETSDLYFDPAVAWGGTWILETGGMVHVSSGSGYSVNHADDNSGAGAKDGGNTDAIVPYHNHGTSVTQPTFTIPNHKHGMGNVWSAGSTGSNTAYAMQSNRNLTTRHTSTDGGGGACNRTTNVAVTVNYAGSNGNMANANMQPYIVINRWHRTG